MAFDIPLKDNIDNLIKLAPEIIPSDQPNILRTLTIALDTTYKDINTLKLFNNNINYNDNYPIDNNGNIIINKPYPIINKRYRITNVINTGTFSTIYNSIDIYNNNSNVAIKILRLGYGILGQRETIFLKFLNRISYNEQSYCKLLLLMYHY